MGGTFGVLGESSIPQLESPKAHGCLFGWSVGHRNCRTNAKARARQRGSVPSRPQLAELGLGELPSCQKASKRERDGGMPVRVPTEVRHTGAVIGWNRFHSNAKRLGATAAQGRGWNRAKGHPGPSSVAELPGCPCAFWNLQPWHVPSMATNRHPTLGAWAREGEPKLWRELVGEERIPTKQDRLGLQGQLS